MSNDEIGYIFTKIHFPKKLFTFSETTQLFHFYSLNLELGENNWNAAVL